ncbi:WD40-repeat-containing domain protein [Pelagophyceae sp. CCMP2097]|nr:WD40-repeat-containing domain protein [Pelagophyceae sp. CCMP2097]|mmetsp:Transcript_21516/g.72967  ORF Transcript_21516/g.72967 Transcript_21516/m.72967 type:complete len:368 (-) Transcript_21516:177-1280(-)
MSRRESTTDAQQKYDLKQKTQRVKDEMVSIRTKIETILQGMAHNCPAADNDGSKPATRARVRRSLKGHFNKVVSVSWYSDSSSLLTAGQDGNAITWDTRTGFRKCVTLRSAWSMFAEQNKCGSGAFCSGGLDNMLSLYEGGKCKGEFGGHDGYISGARFLDDDTLLTSSGDGTLGIFKVANLSSKADDMRFAVFRGHDKDVNGLDLHPTKPGEFISCSSDGSVMLWNVSSSKPHGALRQPGFSAADGGDVNGCKYQANGFGVGLATESRGAFLYDVRAKGPVNTFSGESEAKKAIRLNKCCFSASGRLLFVASAAFGVDVWDTLDSSSKPAKTIAAFTNEAVDVSLSPCGNGVAACSYDNDVAIIAA